MRAKIRCDFRGMSGKALIYLAITRWPNGLGSNQTPQNVGANEKFYQIAANSLGSEYLTPNFVPDAAPAFNGQLGEFGWKAYLVAAVILPEWKTDPDPVQSCAGCGVGSFNSQGGGVNFSFGLGATNCGVTAGQLWVKNDLPNSQLYKTNSLQWSLTDNNCLAKSVYEK